MAESGQQSVPSVAKPGRRLVERTPTDPKGTGLSTIYNSVALNPTQSVEDMNPFDAYRSKLTANHDLHSVAESG